MQEEKENIKVVKVKKDWIDKISLFLNSVTFVAVIITGYLALKEIRNLDSQAIIFTNFEVSTSTVNFKANASRSEFIPVKIYAYNLGNYDTDNWNIQLVFPSVLQIKNFSSGWAGAPRDNSNEGVIKYNYHSEKDLLTYQKSASTYLLSKGNLVGSFEISIPQIMFDESGQMGRVLIGVSYTSGKNAKLNNQKIYFDQISKQFEFIRFDIAWFQVSNATALRIN